MSNSIEFNMFAPRNEGAALISSFSNWKEIPMEKGEDGYFRIQVELEDGIYFYKFRIQSKSPVFEPNEWVEVIDPYATDVDEEKKQGVVRIKDGKRIVDTYVWQHDDTWLPDNPKRVIYERHLADFTGDEDDSHKRGKYLDAIQKLDYLSELGINEIELMPVNKYPGDYRYFQRWNEQGSRVVVVANFSDTVLAEENVPNVPAPGIWHDWLSNCDVEAEENEMVIDLPEYEARVLVFRE